MFENTLLGRLIEFDPFTNIWFYITLYTYWSYMSFRILGVDRYTLHKAKQGNLEALYKIEVLSDFYCSSIKNVKGSHLVRMVAITSFVMGVLLTYGFYYQSHLSQAISFFFFPWAGLHALSHVTARKILEQKLKGAALALILRRQLLITRLFSLPILVFCALWGFVQIVKGYYS